MCPNVNDTCLIHNNAIVVKCVIIGACHATCHIECKTTCKIDYKK